MISEPKKPRIRSSKPEMAKNKKLSNLISESNELKLNKAITEKKKKYQEEEQPKRRLSLFFSGEPKKSKKKALRKYHSEPALYSYIYKKAPELETKTQDKLMKKMKKRFSVKTTDVLLQKKFRSVDPVENTISQIDNLTLIANLNEGDIKYTIENSKVVITSGSISALCSYLVGMGLNVGDAVFVKDFLTTYRYFLTPRDLLNELIAM